MQPINCWCQQDAAPCGVWWVLQARDIGCAGGAPPGQAVDVFAVNLKQIRLPQRCALSISNQRGEPDHRGSINSSVDKQSSSRKLGLTNKIGQKIFYQAVTTHTCKQRVRQETEANRYKTDRKQLPHGCGQIEIQKLARPDRRAQQLAEEAIVLRQVS